MQKLRTLFVVVAMILTSMVKGYCQDYGKRVDFNKDWLFTLNDKRDFQLETFKPEGWRSLNLPHDWSVEHEFDKKNGSGCVAYLPGGIGWYSKTFTTQIDKNSERCFIEFDGVYNNSEVWLNGRLVGTHYFGYSPFCYDLTNYLNPRGKENRLMVKVDRSRFADSRWYPGSGIYRDVKMVITQNLYVSAWGAKLTTPVVSQESALVSLDIEVKNDGAEERGANMVTKYYDPEGREVKSVTNQFYIEPHSEISISQLATLTSPMLWSVDQPNIYTAKSTIYENGKLVCRVENTFGIRSIHFDADKGFFLNGESMKIKGVCIHHDAGLVGAAVPDDVWIRRFKLLKEAGCNAIRTSHNPVSERFLNLCDRMGFLVQEEFFDEWDNPKDKRYNKAETEETVDYQTRGYAMHFQEYAKEDLQSVMLRDRNHPCIIQWSIGNEIEWTYDGNREVTGFFDKNSRGNYFWKASPLTPEQIKARWAEQPEQTYSIGGTAHKLSGWVREMDLTRPITANCILPSASFQSGYTDALDIVGFSYRRHTYDYAKKYYPTKVVMGTEDHGHWHEWKAVLDREFVAGIFVWCGFDFLGERGGNRKDWPHKQSVKGLLDLAAYPKGSYYMFKALWQDKPTIALYTQTEKKSIFTQNKEGLAVEKVPGKWKTTTWMWQDVNEYWNYEDGELVMVEAYSNCEEAELFLNGKSLGRKSLSSAENEDHIYKWAVPYKAGKLVVKGYEKGAKKASTEAVLQSCGEVAQIELQADRATMQANEDDVVHVFVELKDAKGVPVRIADRRVEFEVEGDYRLLGVDNGYSGNVNKFQSMSVETNKGRCMLLLQATDKASKLKIKAKSGAIVSNVVNVVVL